ncbi:SUKH-3 domain-containing protein [Lentzea atacamensis]|uniref:SUKH-3 domain-containing protein n=1 Tax=Lentzea atacamensis TaxID=531938 RepID=UPI000D6BC120
MTHRRAESHDTESVRTTRGDGEVSAERFSSRVEQELRAAGWHPGRAVDVTDWREQLEASGEVRIHRAAAEFLVEFGGLNGDRWSGYLVPCLAPSNNLVEASPSRTCTASMTRILTFGRFATNNRCRRGPACTSAMPTRRYRASTS